MTVTSLDFETKTTAAGDVDVYNFNWKVLEPSDVIVVNLTTAVTLEYGVDYTVTLNPGGVDSQDGDTGGYITWLSPLLKSDGDQLHIYRLEDYLQLTKLGRYPNLNMKLIEKMFDKATIQIQQIREGFEFLEDTVIPGLQELFEDFVNGLLSVLGPGANNVTVGNIPVWTDADPTTLGSGLAPGAAGSIPVSDGNAWTVGTVGALDIDDVIVPGVTNDGGVAWWDGSAHEALGTTGAGTTNQVLKSNGGGNAPSMDDLLTILRAVEPGTAGQVLTSNGAGANASFEDPSATPVGTPAAITPTSNPGGFKIWALNKPGAYAVGGIPAKSTAGTGGDTDYVNNASGSYLFLTTNNVTGRTAKIYTTKDDLAATRSALPIWITRILTGAVITNIRHWIGFIGPDASDLSDMEGSGTALNSTAAFRFDTAEGDVNWMCITCTEGGVITETDSGVAVVADTDYVMAIDMSEYGHVKFLINNVEVQDHSTNLPAETEILNWLAMARTLNAAEKSIGISIVNMSHR